jgi:hypothetical protein
MAQSDVLRLLLEQHPEMAEAVADELRALGYTVTPPVVAQSEVTRLVNYVAIGAGERAPWADEPLTCPTCGAGPLPLQESTSSGMSGAGITLRFIAHCGQTWLRGEVDQ